LFVAKEASNLQGAIEFVDYLLQDSTARLIIEKLYVIPAQPVNPQGLEVPELFKEVLEDLSASPEEQSFGYNIDVLAPQNFNDVMFTGFQEVLAGTRSPAEQSAALQDAWATAKRQGNIVTQD
jgi:raffinose/stachyose/melibiose transport system substrate-binding protein